MFQKAFALWHQLVGQGAACQPTLTDATVTTIDEDRRLWVRYSTDFSAQVELPVRHGTERVGARVCDISLGGANLIVEQTFPIGQILTLELPGQGDELRTMLACVVRVTPQDDGQWSVGCVFSRELTGDDLEAFGAGRRAAADEDQRTWQRFNCQLQANYLRVGNDDDSLRPAQVLNISASGVGLLVHEAIEAGCLLNLDLLNRRGQLVRSILACVVHTTRRRTGEMALGCNFIRELSEAELHALV